MAKHAITYCLLLWGWRRDDSPVECVEECVDVTGCERPGRWTHPHVQGNYCAQHAHQGGADGFGRHDTSMRR